MPVTGTHDKPSGISSSLPEVLPNRAPEGGTRCAPTVHSMAAWAGRSRSSWRQATASPTHLGRRLVDGRDRPEFAGDARPGLGYFCTALYHPEIRRPQCLAPQPVLTLLDIGLQASYVGCEYDRWLPDAQSASKVVTIAARPGSDTKPPGKFLMHMEALT